MKMTPRDLMRAQYVNRWQIVPTTRPQNVAQHSWGVAMLAMELWLRRTGGHPGEAGTDVELGRIAVMALWHDAPEVFTGDIATPTKLYLNARHALDEIEATAGEGYIESQEANSAIAVCVKLADFLEAMYWLMEHGEGSYANEQLHGLNQRFKTYLVDKAPIWEVPALEVWRDLSNPDRETTPFARINHLRARDA